MNERNETHRDALATIIQRGHIERSTSDEIAENVLAYLNYKTLESIKENFATKSP